MVLMEPVGMEDGPGEVLDPAVVVVELRLDGPVRVALGAGGVAGVSLARVHPGEEDGRLAGDDVLRGDAAVAPSAHVPS